MTALSLHEAGATQREIAAALWGAERVAREWHPDGWMRSAVRRRLAAARALLARCRDIAAGR